MGSRITELDAQHLMFRQPAWHGFGRVGPITIGEAQRALSWADAYLDTPFYLHQPQGRTDFEPELYAYPNAKTVILKNYPVAHGHHSDKYQLVQHSFLAEEVLPALDVAGMVKEIESIGTYDDGRIAFISISLPNEITIPGYSEVHNIVNLTNGYDEVTLAMTNSLGIVVCANTMRTNVLNVPSWYSFRHMGDPADLMRQAVSNVIERFKRGEQYARRIERLADTSFTDEMFNQLTETIIGKEPVKMGFAKDGAPMVTRKWQGWDEQRDKLSWRYHTDPDQKAVRYSYWGALMAVQAYEQKDLRVRGVNRGERHHRNLLFGKLPLTDKAVDLLSGERFDWRGAYTFDSEGETV
jgi:hypothetical protein